MFEPGTYKRPVYSFSFRCTIYDFDHAWTRPEADNCGTGNQNTKQVFPFAVLEPTQGSDFSCSVQQQQQKIRAFANSISPLPRVLASQGTGRHQTWSAYAPLS